MDKANHKLPHDPWCIKETGQRLPNDATTAKFYGLPKIHKENIPLRPKVSLPGSPTYDLSK